jgi:glycerol-3-phosphate O-acyltransferase
VVFIPVGLAYDRVMEDRNLVAAAAAGTRRFPIRWGQAAAFLGRLAWQKLRGTFPGFGTAAASFGAPLSLRDFLAATPGAGVETLGAALMDRILRAVPVTPVPLVARVLADGPVAAAALEAAVAARIEVLRAAGAILRLHPGGAAATLAEGLAPLVARQVVAGEAGLRAADPGLLAFYAAPVRQLEEVLLAAAPQT